MSEETSFWGPLTVDPGEMRRVQVGPLTLWLQRMEHEWRVAHLPAKDPDASPETTQVDLEVPQDMLTLEHVQRFAVAGIAGEISLTPALADRPVVARPEKPFCLPEGAEAVVYVSSPLWVVLSTAQDLKLIELPLVRPSDTWFGPSTREGELCYASRTFLRMSLDNVPRRPHRAITMVRILNTAATALPLRALKLPAPHLALYRAGDGQLWTQDITFERSMDDTLATLRVKDRRPAMAPDAEPLTGPRARTSEIPGFQAFSALFSSFGGGQ